MPKAEIRGALRRKKAAERAVIAAGATALDAGVRFCVHFLSAAGLAAAVNSGDSGRIQTIGAAKLMKKLREKSGLKNWIKNF